MPKHSHSGFKPLSARVRAELYGQLAAMETAGLPLDKALGLLRLPRANQTRLQSMRTLVSKGVEPALAGEKSGVFTPLEANLLHAAFSAGSPAITYHRLAKRYTQSAMQAATIKSRMAMPAFVFVCSLFIQPLPGLVTGQLSVTSYFVQCFRPLVALAGILYLITALPNWLRSSSLTPIRFLIDTLRLHIPVFGSMQRRRNVRDFFESLALLLEAGIPILDALPKALDTIDISIIREAFSSIQPTVKRGTTLAQAVSEVSYIRDDRITELIRTGEESGTLPDMLFRFSTMETEAIYQLQQQIADWAPRVVYGLVIGWVTYGVLHNR